MVGFNDRSHAFATSDVRVGVWQKQPEHHRTICYCIVENETDIDMEIGRDGRSRAVKRVRAYIQVRPLRLRRAERAASAVSAMLQQSHAGCQLAPTLDSKLLAMDKTTGVTRQRTTMGSCCATTPSSICFWTAIFLLSYGALSVLPAEWPALAPYSGTLLLTALGIACLVNAGRNRTYHCYITGPLFLVAAIVAALIESDLIHVRSSRLWDVVMMGVVLAFVAEWRASRAQQSS